jgi:hypothetical protein
MVSSANFVIEPLNDRPVAVNDEFNVDVGDGSGPAVIAPTGGVMANDSDIDGDSLTVNLGDVVRGEDAVATFTYRNTGNAPLHILSAKPG